MDNHDDATNFNAAGSYVSSSHPKMPNCVVVLDKKEFDLAATKYLTRDLTPKKYLAKQSPESSVFMGFDSDSDEDRLEIDETPAEASSMPNLDMQGVQPVTTGKGVSIEWAPVNNPKYGSAAFVPKEKKKPVRKPKKEYVDAGTQQRDEDIQRFCNDCIKGKALKAKLEVELAKRGTSLEELTNGGPIGPELIEKVRALVQNPQQPKVHVSSMQVKRITKRALPSLLPLHNISSGNTNNHESDITSTLPIPTNNEDQGLGYTKEEIRMSHFQYTPFNTHPFHFNPYQQPFFNDDMDVTSTTTSICEPNFQPNHSPKFYVNAMTTEPTSINNEPEPLIETDHSGNAAENEGTPAYEETPNEGEHAETNVETANEPEVDAFKINESDKEAVERNGAPAGQIEVFPENTPIGEKTPQGHAEDNDYDDALNIDTDVDFEGEFEETEPANDPKANTPSKGALERQSILSYVEDEIPNTTRKSRFSKIGASSSEPDASSMVGKASSSSNQGNARYVPYNKNKPKRTGSNCNDKKKPYPLPWAAQEDTISPFKSNLFPQQMNANSAKTTASQRLLAEFTKICRDELYSTCTGNINCNGNHTFPHEDWVKQLIDQMQLGEIQQFIASCYKSVPCCSRYFPIFSSFFGRNNMKHDLVQAISMAESHALLLSNYKWIVYGLIRTGVQPAFAIQTLLDNRRLFTPQANKIIVEIIMKINLESHFLAQLVEMSINTVEIYNVTMFHKFMIIAMQDPEQIVGWQVLIENILQNLNAHGLHQYPEMLDQQLLETFINFLA